MRRKCLQIHPNDTVVVVLERSQKGDSIKTDREEIVLLDDIDFAHKAAIIDHDSNSPVVKYGHEIGYAVSTVPKGSWIHSHNMKCDRGRS
jgi:hypothetical protein